MTTLSLWLRSLTADTVEFRWFFENPNRYESRSLPVAELGQAIDQADRLFDRTLDPRQGPAEALALGRQLFAWLDGSDRLLSRQLADQRPEVLAIDLIAPTDPSWPDLGRLPWELLHDGDRFLVAAGIVPVRVCAEARPLTPIERRNRALHGLFMAAAPTGGGVALGFETEEQAILDATDRLDMRLTVEETGCLEDLGWLVGQFDPSELDLLHLTGHAGIDQRQQPPVPVFITETETGDRHDATAADIAQALGRQFPPLVFLSGCQTGEGRNGMPAMARSLVQAGARAVLGWGRPVYDTDATAAAAAIYRGLAEGRSLVDALRVAYGELTRPLETGRSPEWYLLRLFVGGDLTPAIGPLVTAPRSPGRLRAPKASLVGQFLDPNRQTVQVPTRREFVGRRRWLQRGLRVLRDRDSVGVWLQGMGGLGKSSIAARLCDRLDQFQRVVIVGRLDLPRFVRETAWDFPPEQREILEDDRNPLAYRLVRVFDQQARLGQPPFLWVFDDFENCLELRNGTYQLQPAAAEILEAIATAIDRQAFDQPHKLLITTRYDIDPALRDRLRLRHLGIDGFRDGDARKLRERLPGFSNPAATLPRSLVERAWQLGDGNPRLWRWLDQLLSGLGRLDESGKITIDPQGASERPDPDTLSALLDRLAQQPDELREQVLAATLWDWVDQDLHHLLQRAAIYELPVPPAAIDPLLTDIPAAASRLARAQALGLLEQSPAGELRVPRILPLDLPSPPPQELAALACQTLYRLWWEESDSSTEEQRLEIHRLALLGQESEISTTISKAVTNQWIKRSRFREARDLCQKNLTLTADYRVIHNLARSQQELGDVAAALANYQTALDRCPTSTEAEIRDRATIIHNLATLYANRGEIEQAIALYQQSLEIEEQIGNAQGKAATLHELGRIYANRGEIEQAIALYQQSLEIEEQIGNIGGKATTLHNLATLYANRGEIEQAIALYQQSLEIEEQIGNAQGKAATLHELGRIYANRGEIEQAIALYQQSLEIEEQIGNIGGKATTLHELGRIYANRGEIEQAIALFQQSLEIKEQIGNAQGKAMTLQWLGWLKATKLGQIEAGLVDLSISLEILERIGSPSAATSRRAIDQIRNQQTNGQA
ncbi:MAG: CHAT domain-containing tetratricopeptide repeat protein [Limnothrix sp. BL-A-16]